MMVASLTVFLPVSDGKSLSPLLDWQRGRACTARAAFVRAPRSKMQAATPEAKMS
jgi:hypothetical protein